MNKEYKIKLDLNKKLYNKKMAFNQFDENVNDFYIEVTKNNEVVKDLDKSIVTLVAIKPNGEVDAQFIEVKDGQIYADLKPSMCDIVGNYQAKAMIVLEGEIVTTDTINYSVNEDKIISRLNDDIVSDERFTLFTDALARLSTIETSEEQRMINEAERILAEENRKIEEAKRVEAELVRQHEEADRTKYDAIRESNENIRKQNESIRLANETNRIDEEAKRVEEENKRKLAEEERNANYNFMTEDEERRRSEANAHKEAEVLRVQAETNRVNEEAKRRTTEQARVSAENTRVNNENTREANEVVRKNNENQRVEAETQRQSRYNSFITDAEANANNFENYTNNAKVKEEERKSNELDRKSQEDRRISNENERIANENIRKASENARIESEKQRVDAENLRKEKIIEIQTDYDSLKKVIIDENASANLQNQINQTNSQLEHKANNVDLEVERKRIDSFTKLEEGSTTGDAELIDARIGANGEIYENLGDSIRTQFRNIKADIEDFDDILNNSLTDKKSIKVVKDKVATLPSMLVSNKAEIVWNKVIQSFTNFFSFTGDADLPKKLFQYNSPWTFYKGAVVAGNTYFVAVKITNNGSTFTWNNTGTYKNVGDYHYFVISPVSEGASMLFVTNVVGDVILEKTYSIDITDFETKDIDYLISNYGGLDLIPSQDYENEKELFLTSFDSSNNQIDIISSFENNEIRISDNGTLSISDSSCVATVKVEKETDNNVLEVVKALRDDFDEHIANHPSNENEEFKGKKWVAFGDSLTDATILEADKKYCHIIAEKTGLEHINFGVGGTGYKRKENEGICFYQRMANIPKDADLITILGSINDWLPLNKYHEGYDGFTEGDASDTIGNNTLCGYINKTLDVAIQRCPDAKIGLITPPPSKLTLNLDIIRSAIKKVAEYRNIPYLDLWKVSQMRPNDDVFAQKYYYDYGVETMCHPNNAGHEWMYPQILAFIKSIML